MAPVKLPPMSGISALSVEYLWEKMKFFCKSLMRFMSAIDNGMIRNGYFG
jgi:hypothetical protein